MTTMCCEVYSATMPSRSLFAVWSWPWQPPGWQVTSRIVLKPHCCWRPAALPCVATSKKEWGPFMLVPMGMNARPSGPTISVPDTWNSPSAVVGVGAVGPAAASGRARGRPRPPGPPTWARRTWSGGCCCRRPHCMPPPPARTRHEDRDCGPVRSSHGVRVLPVRRAPRRRHRGAPRRAARRSWWHDRPIPWRRAELRPAAQHPGYRRARRTRPALGGLRPRPVPVPARKRYGRRPCGGGGDGGQRAPTPPR